MARRRFSTPCMIRRRPSSPAIWLIMLRHGPQGLGVRWVLGLRLGSGWECRLCGRPPCVTGRVAGREGLLRRLLNDVVRFGRLDRVGSLLTNRFRIDAVDELAEAGVLIA